MTLADLESIDAYSSQVLTDLRNKGAALTDEVFEQEIASQYFTSCLSNGDEVELCPDGASRRVQKADIEEFISLVIEARFKESMEQIRAIQEGIDTVI